MQVVLIGHSNSTRAGPDLIGGGGGGCSCMLLHPTPTCADAGPDHNLQLAQVVFFLLPTGTNTPLAHVVYVAMTHGNLHWWCSSFYSHWCKYSTCALVQLAQCGDGCIFNSIQFNSLIKVHHARRH